MPKTIDISSPRCPETYTIVDDDMFDFLNQYKWSLHTGGYTQRSYITDTFRKCGKKHRFLKEYMHRLITGAKKGEYVDHINGNKLDNRKSNLRICTNAQNGWNQGISKKNTSGYKGVRWHKLAKKWDARIRVNRKEFYLGLFIDIKDAAKAYNEAALQYHGEFAYINKIN